MYDRCIYAYKGGIIYRPIFYDQLKSDSDRTYNLWGHFYLAYFLLRFLTQCFASVIHKAFAFRYLLIIV